MSATFFQVFLRDRFHSQPGGRYKHLQVFYDRCRVLRNYPEPSSTAGLLLDIMLLQMCSSCTTSRSSYSFG